MDRGQFLQAFLQHRQVLLAFIVSILRDREAAEDVFQDVALIAFDKCSAFQEGTDFGAWVREIARRRILKAREGATRRLVALDPEAIESIAAAHDRSAPESWREREKVLERCLDKLPERHRLLVRYRYQELLDFDAIAARLRSTVNSVQVTLTKVRKALRRCAETSPAAEA